MNHALIDSRRWPARRSQPRTVAAGTFSPCGDPAMPNALGASRQCHPNPFGHICSAQQQTYRQQHMSDQTGSAARPPRPYRTTESLDVSSPGIPPTAQHTVAACRARDRAARQPGLDADRISLYRHHQCLRALQRGTPQARQDFSGVPRTHQFLVTLTVHTNKINPATTPPATSADSMTND